MATYRFNPNEPIPNNPFYSPLTDGLQSIAGPLVIGSGLTVDYATSTITASGGGGGGGPVLVVSPITNVGTTTAPVIGIQNATIGQLGAVQIGANISVLNGVISVASATTGIPGVVQLNNTTSSTSILEALTANQGRLLQQQINALATAGNLILAGTFDASISEMVTVSVDGSSAGFVVAANLPFPDVSIADYYVIVSEAGTYTPPGSAVAVTANVGDWFLCDGTAWQYLALGLDIPYATETTPGVIEIATLAEVQAGTDNTRAVTPATLVGSFVNTCILTAKGDIVAATAASTPTALAVGADGTVLTACAAAPTGLVWSTASVPAIPCACITAKGALISGSAAGLPSTLDVGTNCQLLTANSACPLGLEWKSYSNTAIPCACVTGKGSIISGSGPGLPLALPVGTNGQVLIANNTASTGLQWITNPAILCCVLTGRGSILTATSTGTPADLPVGTNGQVLVACSLVPQGLQWVTNPAILCTAVTGKGAILTGIAASVPTALPVGTDGQVLTACSACTSGLAWISASTSAIPCTCVISKGALVTGTAPGIPVGLAPGSDGTTLTACAACPLGLTWSIPVTNTIPCACVTQRGALITGTGAGAVVSLPPGSNNQVLIVNSACPTGIGWVNNPNIPCTFITGKGAIITGTAAGVPAAFAPGSDGQVLVACSSAACGLAWASSNSVPCSCYTGKGVLLGGTGPATMTALPPGSNGQLLYADNTAATGLLWASPTYLPCSIVSGKGSLITANSAGIPITLAVGGDGQTLVACAACVSGLTWQPASAAAIPCACITSKGTIVAGSGPNTPSSVAIGTDGQILTACAACTAGVAWSSNTAIPCACLTAKGTLLTATGPSAVSALPVGSDGAFLVADSGCAQGVKWTNAGLFGDTPVGAVEWFAMATPPSGWLVADGRTVSRTTYAALFDAIGTTYGAGDGSTTFNLPDLRGMTIKGWDSAGGTARGCDPGRAFGSTQAWAVGCHCHAITMADGLAGVPEWEYPNFSSTQRCWSQSVTTSDCARSQGYTDVTGAAKNLVDNVALLPCIKWQVTLAPNPTGGIPCGCITAKGTLVTGNAPDSPTALPVGTDGQLLVADSAAPDGLTWSTPEYPTRGLYVGNTNEGAPSYSFGCNAYAISPGVWMVVAQGAIQSDNKVSGCLTLYAGSVEYASALVSNGQSDKTDAYLPWSLSAVISTNVPVNVFFGFQNSCLENFNISLNSSAVRINAL